MRRTCSDQRRNVVLAASPHLDDAAYSIGGTLCRLAGAGHRVVVATAFTASVARPKGFALACQLDKGLPADIDYMALRRGEDEVALRRLGVLTRHLGLPEAPHRGYHSACALFGDVHAADAATSAGVRAMLDALVAELRPDLILAPQALGSHVDHVHVVRALAALPHQVPMAWWRDLPYAIRRPAARPAPEALRGSVAHVVDIGSALSVKLDACSAYASQNGFQFGGEVAMRAALAEDARANGERFLYASPVKALIDGLLVSTQPQIAPCGSEGDAFDP